MDKNKIKMIENIDHINIVVKDLEKSITFYTELLGFTLFRRARLKGEWIDKVVGLKDVEGEVAYIRAPGGEPRIELLQYFNPAGGYIADNSNANTLGLRHIAFRVDDIQGICRKLDKGEVNFYSEPVTVPSGVIKHEAGHKTLVYFLDPDGVLLELAEYK